MVYYKNRKSKKYNKKKKKNTKKVRKYTRKRMYKGGGECKSYIITGAHGFIIYDKEEFITIPDNIRLTVYSDFCGKACNNVKTIIKYICNKEQNKINEIGYNILNPGSKIPELYVIPSKRDNIQLSDCNNNVIYQEIYEEDKNSNKAIPLSHIIEKLKENLKANNLEDTKIELHWTICLDVIDKERIKIEEPDNSFLSKNKYDYTEQDFINYLKYILNSCDEERLGIEYNIANTDFKNCKIKIKKNTLQILSKKIEGKNVTIYLTYPEIIKEKYLLPNLIKKLEERINKFIAIISDKIKSINLDEIFREFVVKKINHYIKNGLIPNENEIFENIIHYNINNDDITIDIDMTTINNESVIDIIINIIYFSLIELPIK
jgi:hypothetical protein